jgi:manganese efflux pump family protein
MGESVAVATVIAWSATALLGLYMFAVWLIENDLTSRGTIPSRLPVPVIFAHLLLAVAGLLVWVVFLALDRKTLAWAAVGTLVAIALLGATMFARWIPVYRESAPPERFPGDVRPIRPEGNFPVVIVAAHGLCAVSTLILAVLTALG